MDFSLSRGFPHPWNWFGHRRWGHPPPRPAKTDLAAELPAASTQLIRKVLPELKREKKARLTGRGRSARWRVIE